MNNWPEATSSSKKKLNYVGAKTKVAKYEICTGTKDKLSKFRLAIFQFVLYGNERNCHFQKGNNQFSKMISFPRINGNFENLQVCIQKKHWRTECSKEITEMNCRAVIRVASRFGVCLSRCSCQAFGWVTPIVWGSDACCETSWSKRQRRWSAEGAGAPALPEECSQEDGRLKFATNYVRLSFTLVNFKN